MGIDITERLAKERRARLAAERLLEQKSRELFAANEKLALHARSLSDQIVEQRHVVRNALSEAEVLKGQNARFTSELDRAHTAAVMAERRLRDSIDTIHDGFAVFDSEGKLVTANRAYLSTFQKNDVASGISYEEILRICIRDDMIELEETAPEAWVASMLARWEADPITPMTVRFSNGTWVKLVDRRGRDGGMVSLVLNITEQMRIWAAIETIPDGFVIYDREDRLLICNQRYRDIYPASAPAMLTGTRFEDILRFGLAAGQYADAVGREDDWLSERMHLHNHPAEAIEQHLGDGRWLRVLEQATPDGGRVGLRVDITEWKEQQTALETARIAAESANRAKSAFLANMSHEIRTPMNGVVGMAELLCESPLTEEQRLFADTIRSSGEALLVIINDILDYSKIEAERLTLNPEPFDLERIIHEIVMLLQPKARSRGIDLLIDFDMFLPTSFVGDPGRIRQILTNLIGNAVKFTEVGHVLVRVIGGEADPGGQTLHITVEDTGIGISAENLDHVFGEFNQVESEANRKFEGTGLGLAITRRLIERMGGSVWVDSEFGKGSSFGFRLTLPVAETETEADRSNPMVVKSALVVDDQFINRTILERQLVTCGIAVTLCRSGAEALAVLAQGHVFDVILTDHVMPDMNGLQLTSEIRKSGNAVPIVLLSSNPTEARESDQAVDLAAILQKPILRSDLYRKLQNLSKIPEPPAPEPVVVDALEARRMRVLAAEDNRTNQLVFRKMVKDLAIELVFANNGREAVELFQSFDPDMIFMDISMPEMDGREAATAIRSLEAGYSHVPIVALTAHAMDGDETSIFAAGIDRYMTKPLRKNAIFDAIAEFCPDDVGPVLSDVQTGVA